MTDRLRRHYLAYLDALNERRFDDLVDFVAPDLMYNAEPMTGQQYRRQRQAEAEAIPDLRFTVDLLVVEGDRVACRLDFECSPVKPFLGFPPPRRPIRFAEHVFYRFADGLIVAVTSLIDRAAIAAQVTGEPR